MEAFELGETKNLPKIMLHQTTLELKLNKKGINSMPECEKYMFEQ